MARGAGRVFRRGLRWWISFYFRGREHREAAGATEPEARAHLAGRLEEIRRDQVVVPRDEIAELVSAALEVARRRAAADPATANPRELVEAFGPGRAFEMLAARWARADRRGREARR